MQSHSLRLPPSSASSGTTTPSAGSAAAWGTSAFGTPPHGAEAHGHDDSFTSGSDWTAGYRTGSPSPLLAIAGNPRGPQHDMQPRGPPSAGGGSAFNTPSGRSTREAAADRRGLVQAFAPPALDSSSLWCTPPSQKHTPSKAAAAAAAAAVAAGSAAQPPQWMLDEIVGRLGGSPAPAAPPQQQQQKSTPPQAPALAAAVAPTPPTPPLPPLIAGGGDAGGAPPPVPGLVPLEAPDAASASPQGGAEAPAPDAADVRVGAALAAADTNHVRRVFDLEMLEALTRARLERCVLSRKNRLLALIATHAVDKAALTTLLPVDRWNHDGVRYALRTAVLEGNTDIVAHILTTTAFGGLHQIALNPGTTERDEQDTLYATHLPEATARVYAATRKCESFYTLALELCLMAGRTPTLDDSTKSHDPDAVMAFADAEEKAAEVWRRIEVFQLLSQSAYACPNLVLDAMDAVLHISCRREPLSAKIEKSGGMLSLASTPSRDRRRDDNDDDVDPLPPDPKAPPPENAVGLFNTGVPDLDRTLFFWRNRWLVEAAWRNNPPGTVGAASGASSGGRRSDAGSVSEHSDAHDAPTTPAKHERTYFHCCAYYHCRQPPISTVAISPMLVKPMLDIMSLKNSSSYNGGWGMHWAHDAARYFSIPFRGRVRAVYRVLDTKLNTKTTKYTERDRNAELIEAVVAYMDWGLAGPARDAGYPLRSRMPRSDSASRLPVPGAAAPGRVGAGAHGAHPPFALGGGRGGVPQPKPLHGAPPHSMSVAMMRAAAQGATTAAAAAQGAAAGAAGSFPPAVDRPSESNKISFLNYSVYPVAKDLFDISAALAPYGVHTGQKVALATRGGAPAAGVIVGIGRDGHLYWTKDSRGAVRLQMSPQEFRTLLVRGAA